MPHPDKDPAGNKFWSRVMIIGMGLLVLVYVVVTFGHFAGR
jgi:hypothetical protein